MVISKEARQALVLETRKAATPAIAAYPHLIICGPSGCGKSTVIHGDPQSIVKVKPDIYDPLVTAATRAPRAMEIDGKDYHFMTVTDFGMTDFFETNEYLGNQKLYGTPVWEIERIALTLKKRMVLNIDPNGAMAIKEAFGRDMFTVFLSTSLPVLEQRLLGRLDKTGETKEDVKKRLIAAEKEHAMVRDKVFVPDFILPYDDIPAPQATNIILFEGRQHYLQVA